MEVNSETVVVALYPGAPLDVSGMMLGDKVVSVNGVAVSNDADRWIQFFHDENKEIVVNRKGRLLALQVPKSEKVFYQRYFLKKNEQANASKSEEHTSELQSRPHLVCRLLLEKKNTKELINKILI